METDFKHISESLPFRKNIQKLIFKVENICVYNCFTLFKFLGLSLPKRWKTCTILRGVFPKAGTAHKAPTSEIIGLIKKTKYLKRKSKEYNE
jgi:hypothetical protein